MPRHASTRAFRVGLVLFLASWAFAGVTSPCFASGNKSADHPDTKDQVPDVEVRRPPINTAPIQMNVDRVVVPVTVTDPFDRIVTGLGQSNFEIYDDKVEQKILTFATEDAPISVGMVFDTSGSMSDKIQKSKEAALEFFKT